MNNDAEQIVGTWKTETVNTKVNDEIIFTFNPNGTYSVSGEKITEESKNNGNYFISKSKLILRNNDLKASFIDYYLSPDGKFLSFEYFYGIEGWGKDHGGKLWFNKQ